MALKKDKNTRDEAKGATVGQEKRGVTWLYGDPPTPPNPVNLPLGSTLSLSLQTDRVQHERPATPHSSWTQKPPCLAGLQSAAGEGFHPPRVWLNGPLLYYRTPDPSEHR